MELYRETWQDFSRFGRILTTHYIFLHFRFLDKIDCEQHLSVIISAISEILNELFSRSTSMSSIRMTLNILNSTLSDTSIRTLTILETNFLDIIQFFCRTIKIFDQHLRYLPESTRKKFCNIKNDTNNFIGFFRSKLDKTSELEMIDGLHAFLQTLIVVIERSCSFQNVDRRMMRKLYYALRKLLKYEQIPLNTINNCGLLIVTLDYDYFELTSSFRVGSCVS